MLSRLVHMSTVLVAFLTLQLPALGQFESRSSSPVVDAPQSIVLADFNHDGKIDVATTALLTSEVAVSLGKGDGTLQPAVYYLIDSQGESAYWIATADFNGDGNADLAVADYLGNNVSILLGNGDGTFQPPVRYPTTKRPTFVATGDFNGDGRPDLIVADAPYVSVLLGNGDGTFQMPLDNDSLSPAGFLPVALGDFNHDGKLDAVVLTLDNLEIGILLGNGDGTFDLTGQYAAGAFTSSVVVGDFNGDHKLDLAVSDDLENQIYILLGNGDGTFQAEPPFFSNEPAAMTSADVNGDGKLDLVLFTGTNPFPRCQVTVMLGNGNGTFQAPTSYQAFGEPAQIAVADLNGDRKPDIVAADYLGNGLDVLLNTGVVAFTPTTPLGFSPQLLGGVSPSQKVTMTNMGTNALSIASISAKQPFQLTSGTTCGKSLAAGARCTLSVVFKPTTIGFQNGLVAISDSASSKPQMIELSGTGTTLTASPPQINFGSQKVGTQSAPQNVTVTNTGSIAIKVAGVSIAGADPFDYLETNTCGKQIAPGATCTVSITFFPQAKGTRTASTEITGPNNAEWQSIFVTGMGT